MRELNMGLPARDFIRPSTGVVDVTVCAKSGKLRTAACNEGEVTLSFLAGTQPWESCTLHSGVNLRTAMVLENTVRTGSLTFNDENLLGGLVMPQMPIDLSKIPARGRTGPEVQQVPVQRVPPQRPALAGNALLEGDEGLPPPGEAPEPQAPEALPKGEGISNAGRRPLDYNPLME
jgi:penicillin-binding protein 1A